MTSLAVSNYRTPGICIRSGCTNSVARWDICQEHYEARPFCGYDGCQDRVYARGYCAAHNRQLRADKRLGPKGERWARLYYPKPLREVTTGHGYRMYIFSYRHPDTNALAKCSIMAHRLVMEEALGRGLSDDETVHHINGVRHDNRLANLELWNTGHPRGQRVEDKVEWALEILNRYRNLPLPTKSTQSK